MLRYAPAYLLLTLFFFAGCASHKPDLSGQTPSPELLNSRLTAAWSQMDHIEGRLKLQVKNTQFSGTMFGTLYLAPIDQLSLSLKMMFGISVGDIVITDGRYEAWFATGQFETGSVEDFDLQEITGVPFPAKDLIRIFEPLPRAVSATDMLENTVSFEVTETDSLWKWRLAEASLEHQILYNPTEDRVLEERWLEAGTQSLVLLKEYSQFTRLSGVALAQSLKLRGGGAYPTELGITFDTLELNPEWKTDPFQLKANDW